MQRDSLGAHEDAIATLKGLLALDPTHRRALEMLGELYVAVERWRDAADAYLATATAAEQRAEAKVAHRARIALAELQIGRLGEHDEAVKTLTQALQRAPGDAASLRLLAVAQQKRGDPARAAAALTELADATPRGEKARILVELAELLARDADDPVGAAAALQRAAADSPGDREPMRRLEQHFAAIGDWEGLARSLAWAVDHAGGDARTTALLRVELARTLIEKQGRVAAGVEHLEAVLEAQPGNVAARFAMARRHMLPPGRPDLAEEQYRRILADDPWSLQALGELFRVLSGGKEPARAWPVAALLAYFGDADAATAAASPPPARGSLGADGYDELVREEAESRQFCRLLRTAQVTIEKVYPPDLERHGASRDDRAGPGDVLGASVVEVCKRLGVEMCETFISHRNRHVCAVEPGDPPRVVVGVGLTSYATAARRFELGRALGPIVGGGLLFQKVPRRELPALLSAIVGTVVKGYAGMGDPDEVTELTRRVSRAVPRRLRKALEEPARAAASGPLPDLDGWIAAAARSADLCGLLACGDVAAALDAVRRREESRAPTPHETPERRIAALDDYGPAEDLARYWLSPRCEKALGRLGAPPR